MRVSKKHDVRLHEILDAAQSLFAQKGYEETTVNDILDRVGIGKGTFYHYFQSKEDALAGVISRVVEGIYHTPYPLETVEFLLASIQFFLDDSVFQWKPEELATRAQACVRVIELSLAPLKAVFVFLLDAPGPETGETVTTGFFNNTQNKS
jgi:AcrR family transcriptional regulator